MPGRRSWTSWRCWATTQRRSTPSSTPTKPAPTQTGKATATVDLSTGFHTYGVRWAPDAVEWYLDGNLVFSAATPADLNKPMYLLANLAVGGNWPGSPDGTTPWPAEMRVDHIKAYAIPLTLTGTGRADTLVGEAAADRITGAGGNDTMTGGGTSGGPNRPRSSALALCSATSGDGNALCVEPSSSPRHVPPEVQCLLCAARQHSA